MRITKEFHFHAAHRINRHPGPCAWLHGHTYGLAVTVEARDLDALDMVLDFGDLADVVRLSVLDRWDHATLLRRDDPLVAAIAAAEPDAHERLALFGEHPTAEVLAREAFQAIAKRLPERVSLVRVAIRETATSEAEYGRDDES
jgi:6-pyruvoyltetrahydropterin/6-carboxytetrahydropterin synthase